MRRIKTLAAAGAAALAGLVATSGAPHAQTQAKPVPGCAGLAAVDPAGDASTQTGAAPENLDLTGLFFLTEGSRTTANVQVKNLSRTLPSASTGISYYVTYTAGEATRFVAASTDGGEVTYEHGTFAANTYTPEGETSGTFTEGSDGVVSIVVPSASGELGAPTASATTNLSLPLVGGLLTTADTAPDEGAGKTYKVEECAAAADPTPTPTPAGGARDVALEVTSVTGNTTRKTVTLKLKTDTPLTGVRATLKRSGKTVGTGKRSKLKRTGTLVIKVRSVRRGTYALTLKARRASDKAPVSKAYTVKLG